MITEAVYTSIGAAALAVDFVTNPTKQQNFLKKAERRGAKLATTSQQRLRPVTNRVEKAIDEVRTSSLAAIGVAEKNVEKSQAAAKRQVKKTVSRARTSTPRVRVARRTTRAKLGTSRSPRRVTRTTISLDTPKTASAS